MKIITKFFNYVKLITQPVTQLIMGKRKSTKHKSKEFTRDSKNAHKSKKDTGETDDMPMKIMMDTIEKLWVDNKYSNKYSNKSRASNYKLTTGRFGKGLWEQMHYDLMIPYNLLDTELIFPKHSIENTIHTDINIDTIDITNIIEDTQEVDFNTNTDNFILNKLDFGDNFSAQILGVHKSRGIEFPSKYTIEDFEEGEEVVIMSSIPEDKEDRPVWVEEMNKYAGHRAIVVNIMPNRDWVRVKLVKTGMRGFSFSYKPSWLHKVMDIKN